MASRDSDTLFDLRTVKRNINAGLLDRTRYAEFLESLPDMADNVMTPEEGDEGDAFENMGSPPDEEEDEASGASEDSMTSVLPQVRASVPAAPAAAEAAPVQPPVSPKTAPVQPPVPTEAAPVQPPVHTEAAAAPAPPSFPVPPDAAEDGDPFADAPLPGQMQVTPAMPTPAQPAASDDHEPDGD